MRTLMGCGLVLALIVVAGANAATKADPDPKKLLGKWEPTGKDVPEGLKAVIEFSKDDKMKIDVEFSGKKESKTGTYKLDGNKLTVTIDGDKAKTSTVEKLTDDVLEIKNEGGKTTTFGRVKAK